MMTEINLTSENHAYKPIEQYGQTLFDCKTKKIKNFTKEKPLYNDYAFDLVVFAWNIDPLAYKFPAMSPYSAFANNPIIFVDFDGREVFLSNNKYTTLLNNGFDVFYKTNLGKMVYEEYTLSKVNDIYVTQQVWTSDAIPGNAMAMKNISMNSSNSADIISNVNDAFKHYDEGVKENFSDILSTDFSNSIGRNISFVTIDGQAQANQDKYQIAYRIGHEIWSHLHTKAKDYTETKGLNAEHKEFGEMYFKKENSMIRVLKEGSDAYNLAMEINMQRVQDGQQAWDIYTDKDIDCLTKEGYKQVNNN